jgi:hypothetical protein
MTMLVIGCNKVCRIEPDDYVLKDGEYDPLNRDRSTVPDGGSSRVPLYLMDGTSQPARSEVAP